MVRFETQYPLESRSKEIKEVLAFVSRGQSCQLISVPGAGRSTILRLLLYHEKLREHHIHQLNEGKSPDAFPHESFLFVYINFAELVSFDTTTVVKHIFLALLDAVEDQQELRKGIRELFEEGVRLGDPALLSLQLRKAVLLLPQFHIVFLFDRFSEFAEKTSGDFFTVLKTLRTATGGRVAVVFSTHRPLESLLPRDHWKDFYEFFVGNHVYLDMHDEAATTFRVNILEKEYGRSIDETLKKEQIKLTGGHGKLMKLSTQITLTENKKLPNVDLEHFLISNILIRGSLLEIWESLTREEKQAIREEKTSEDIEKLHLPFPLLSEFARRNLAETLVPKTIRLNEKTNEIYYGDAPIADLTGTEFKLLTFLIRNPDRVCDRDEIINAVWKDSKSQEGVSDEALDQMIYRMRKKIEDEADNPKHVITVKGRGFRFIP